MDLIQYNLGRILNLNFLFLSITASILGGISVEMTSGNADGLLALFLFFAGEISKDLLQQEKRTRRLEWKIANGIGIGNILAEHTIVLWLGTVLLLSPLGVIMACRAANPSFLTVASFAASSLFYAACINIAVLWCKNMNHFRSIPVFMTAGHLLIAAVKNWIYDITGSKVLLILFPLIVIMLFITVGFFSITKERIASSYY